MRKCKLKSEPLYTVMLVDMLKYTVIICVYIYIWLYIYICVCLFGSGQTDCPRRQEDLPHARAPRDDREPRSDEASPGP